MPLIDYQQLEARIKQFNWEFASSLKNMTKRELNEILPLTHQTKRFKKVSKEGAKIMHNLAVKQAFQKAKRGAIINLTDLMASKEKLLED